MYIVIKYFTDLEDEGRPYQVGAVFPRKGKKVSRERLLELSGNHNKQGEPLIEWVEPVEPEAGKASE